MDGFTQNVLLHFRLVVIHKKNKTAQYRLSSYAILEVVNDDWHYAKNRVQEYEAYIIPKSWSFEELLQYSPTPISREITHSFDIPLALERNNYSSGKAICTAWSMMPIAPL